MKKQLELMADYDCYPLWEHENNDLVDNPSPATLPLSSETIARLEKWADDYDSILNRSDPALSGFPNKEQEEAFEIEGINLWLKLKEELGTDYEIVYFSHKLQKTITDPNELLIPQVSS